MTGFEALLDRLLAGRDLSPEETGGAVRSIMAGEWSDAQTAAFLVALSGKGETAAEISAGAQVMRDYATEVETGYADLVDTCGTGGDGKGTFNVSTASAVVAACAGARVAKHGNRSVSSNSGSADFLEAAGVKLELSPEQVARCIGEIGIGFLFAPVFHGAMKHAAPARRAIGIRSVFNLLGPLTNPARATRQLIGVFDAKWLRPMAEAARLLGVERVMVVHAEDGLDEISVGSPTQVAELCDGELREYRLSPDDFGCETASLASVTAADVGESLAIVERAFAGETGPASDVIAINAAAAAYVAGRVQDLREGAAAAREAMQSGAAARKLKQWADFTRSL